MVWPTVTELPRKLEPTTEDTFTQDLNERTVPRGETASRGRGELVGQPAQERV